MKRIALLITITLTTIGASIAPAQAQPRGARLPENAFQFRLGYLMQPGGGTVWEENEEAFTLSATDFNDFVWGLSFGRGLANNVELGFNVDFYDSTVSSEYRDYVDEYGYFILHDTHVRQVPLTIDFRLLPTGRYRGRGSLQPVLYLALGGGLNLWKYEESGEFIDFSSTDLAIFPSHFVDSGVTWEAHAAGGLEVPMNRGFSLLFEGRYSWSEAELEGDFAGLGNLQLGGASVYVGGSFRF